MIARAGSGWQTVLADLSLILFMVMAAAVQQMPDATADDPMASLPQTADPVAVWSAGPGGPDLAQWLAEQPNDPRQRLTILADPVAAGAAAALITGIDRPARVILERGLPLQPQATLTFDTAAQPEDRR
jgi:hypothetical protein